MMLDANSDEISLSIDVDAQFDSDVYNSSKTAGRWTNEEHKLFLLGLQRYQKQWKLIAELVQTRTIVQIRTHAQKYFQKQSRSDSSCEFTSSAPASPAPAACPRPRSMSVGAGTGKGLGMGVEGKGGAGKGGGLREGPFSFDASDTSKGFSVSSSSSLDGSEHTNSESESEAAGTSLTLKLSGTSAGTGASADAGGKAKGGVRKRNRDHKGPEKTKTGPPNVKRQASGDVTPTSIPSTTLRSRPALVGQGGFKGETVGTETETAGGQAGKAGSVGTVGTEGIAMGADAGDYLFEGMLGMDGAGMDMGVGMGSISGDFFYSQEQEQQHQYQQYQHQQYQQHHQYQQQQSHYHQYQYQHQHQQDGEVDLDDNIIHLLGKIDWQSSRPASPSTLADSTYTDLDLTDTADSSSSSSHENGRPSYARMQMQMQMQIQMMHSGRGGFGGGGGGGGSVNNSMPSHSQEVQGWQGGLEAEAYAQSPFSLRQRRGDSFENDSANSVVSGISAYGGTGGAGGVGIGAVGGGAVGIKAGTGAGPSCLKSSLTSSSSSDAMGSGEGEPERKRRVAFSSVIDELKMVSMVASVSVAGGADHISLFDLLKGASIGMGGMGQMMGMGEIGEIGEMGMGPGGKLPTFLTLTRNLTSGRGTAVRQGLGLPLCLREEIHRGRVDTEASGGSAFSTSSTSTSAPSSAFASSASLLERAHLSNNSIQHSSIQHSKQHSMGANEDLCEFLLEGEGEDGGGGGGEGEGYSSGYGQGYSQAEGREGEAFDRQVRRLSGVDLTMDGGGGYPSNASASASASAFATYSTTSGVGVGSSGDSHSNGNGLSKEVEGILLSGSDRLGALTPTASGGKGMSVMPPSLATLTLTTGGLGEAVCVQAVGQDAPPRKRGRPRKYPLGLPATSGTTTAPTAPAPSVPSALHGHSTRGKRRLKPKPRAEEALSDTPHPVTDPTDPHAHTHAYMQSQVLQQMQMMRPYGALVFGGSREGREGEGEGREGVVGEGGGGVEGGEDFSLLGEDMGGDMEDGFDVFGMLEDFE